MKHTVLHSKNKREGLDFISMTFRSTLRLLTQTTGPTGIFHLKNRHLDKICTQYQHSANFEHLCRESHTHITRPSFQAAGSKSGGSKLTSLQLALEGPSAPRSDHLEVFHQGPTGPNTHSKNAALRTFQRTTKPSIYPV